MPKTCYNCKTEWSNKFSPGFREECPNCDQPLHCCRNCRFYDEQAYQWCVEPQARGERPREAEASNICDYFIFADREAESTAASRQNQARNGLHTLFGEEPADDKGSSSTDNDKPDWMKFEKPDRPVI